MIKQSKPTVVSVRSVMVSQWFCVGPTSMRWALRKQSNWPWNMIHSTPRGNPCRHYIHLAPFTYSLARRLEPSAKLELGPAPPFPPTRALEVYQWSRAPSLVCEVALPLAVSPPHPSIHSFIHWASPVVTPVKPIWSHVTTSISTAVTRDGCLYYAAMAHK